MQSISEMLEAAGRYEPDRIAVFSDSDACRMTYKELNENINKLANGLIKLGIRRGDFVMMLIPNSLRFIITFYAIIKAGATVVPLNVMYQAHEIGYIGQDNGARALIADADLWASSANIKSQLPDLQHVIISKGPAINGTTTLDAVFTDDATPPTVDAELDDIVCVIYTSGTTGRPKGATQTHRSIFSNVIGISVDHKFSKDDRMVCGLPMYNNFALSNVLTPAFFIGASVIVIDRFDARKVLDAIKKHGGSYFPGVPTMFSYLLQEYREGYDDVSSLRVVNGGGANCPPELIRQIENTFHVRFMNNYGHTESCGPTTLSPYIGIRKENSVGTPSNCLVKIFDNDDNECPVGQTGEIVERGDIFSVHGYYKRPEINAEVYRKGWFHSGDMGHVDEDGYLYVTGRKQDLIITGGQNIYPVEVEDAIYTHPKVLHAAVIGIPDKEKGELAKAYVVLKKGETATEKEIIDYVRDCIAKFKAPRHVEFVESLPLGPTGKILKRELMEMLKNRKENRM